MSTFEEDRNHIYAGVKRTSKRQNNGLEMELWSIPYESLFELILTYSKPGMGFNKIVIQNDNQQQQQQDAWAILMEPFLLEQYSNTTKNITSMGGWRNYLKLKSKL